ATTNNAPTGALGESVYDTATVSVPPGGFTPTGTVTYNFYNTTTPIFGTTVPVTTQTVTLSGGLVPNSNVTGALIAGGYSYIAVYSGDANYAGSTGAIEPLTINKANTITATIIKDAVTNGAPTGTIGESVYDTATVSGTPFTPTGTVTYQFYHTINGTGPHTDQVVTLNGGAVPNSAPTGPLAAGSYSYVAVYSGDANYNGSTGDVEPLTINKGFPMIVTTPSPTNVTLSTTTVTLNDAANLSNGFNPTGTITFTLVYNGSTDYTYVVRVN